PQLFVFKLFIKPGFQTRVNPLPKDSMITFLGHFETNNQNAKHYRNRHGYPKGQIQPEAEPSNGNKQRGPNQFWNPAHPENVAKQEKLKGGKQAQCQQVGTVPQKHESQGSNKDHEDRIDNTQPETRLELSNHYWAAICCAFSQDHSGKSFHEAGTEALFFRMIPRMAGWKRFRKPPSPLRPSRFHNLWPFQTGFSLSSR
ncbi:MAG: hypothetical protein ACLFN9_23745, partial [Desulfococcaceae bacterium]